MAENIELFLDSLIFWGVAGNTSNLNDTFVLSFLFPFPAKPSLYFQSFFLFYLRDRN